MKILRGDITTLKVDAIVNAANSTLLGGGGVDGAIHRAAGPDLLTECRHLGGCKTGEAKLSSGYNLLAKYIIHTVGPVWNGGSHNEADLLRQCYWNTLSIAQREGFESIAFPCISTGVYGYPPEEAAKIAVGTSREYLVKNSYNAEVTFCCFSQRDLELYSRLVQC